MANQKHRKHKESKGINAGAKKRPLDEGAKVLLGKGLMDDDSFAKRRKAFGL